MDLEAALGRRHFLPLLDFFVEELLDTTALQTDDVIVMAALVQFEHSLAAFEMMAYQQAGLLELGQYAIDRGQSDVLTGSQQNLVDVFRRQMPLLAVLEQAEHLQSGQGGLEAGIFEFVGLAHGSMIH